MHNDYKKGIIIVVMIILFMTQFALITKEHEKKDYDHFKLCNALNNGDYVATWECIDND